jgi:hypothetical protein
MIGPGYKQFYGQLELQAASNTTLTNAGQYYKIAGTFADGFALGFRVASNTLIYTGPSGVVFLFNGESELQVDKACRTYYALFLNGLEVPGANTPHDFVSPAKTASIGITHLVSLNQNDVIEVYAKSDAATTILHAETLTITFWG